MGGARVGLIGRRLGGARGCGLEPQRRGQAQGEKRRGGTAGSGVVKVERTDRRWRGAWEGPLAVAGAGFRQLL